jgi:hypothetical protein
MLRFGLIFIYIGAVLGAMASPVSLTGVAAVTTIAVNVITIRETSARVVKVWRASRKVTVKAVTKVTGKS